MDARVKPGHDDFLFNQTVTVVRCLTIFIVIAGLDPAIHGSGLRLRNSPHRNAAILTPAAAS
jgi:hypothetical protein